METNQLEKDDCTILQLIGDLDATTSAEAQDSIEGAINDHCKVVLDMAGCGYISSAGLRVLLIAHKSAQNSNSKLVLSGVSADVKEVMEMTGFDRFFAFYADMDAAVKALNEQ